MCKKIIIKTIDLFKNRFFCYEGCPACPKNFSFYTLIEVLREEIVTAKEKKMWVMENILSLDDEELKKKGKSLKKRGKKLNKKDHDKMRRKTRLQEWADSL